MMSTEEHTEATGHTGGEAGYQAPAPDAEGQVPEPAEAGRQPDSRRSRDRELTITQSALNQIIQGRLAEAQRQFEERLRQERERWERDALARWEQEKQQAIEEAIRARDLEHAREQIAREYGLNEHQKAVLQGSTPEELRECAERLFPRIVPPRITPGAEGRTVSATSLEESVRSALRQLMEKR